MCIMGQAPNFDAAPLMKLNFYMLTDIKTSKFLVTINFIVHLFRPPDK